jgi:polyisoprenoid-binding protein YceI
MRLMLPFLVALSFTACVQDVGKGRVQAEVQDVPAADSASAPVKSASAVTLKVDPSSSSVRALGAKITATHPIDFQKFDGQVEVDDNALTGVSFEVEMSTLESDHPKLTEHLKTEDFFHVEKFPKATFTSVSIEQGAKAEGDWTHTVTGDFTIRGTTKRISFPAKVQVDEAQVTASTEFVINRKDFEVVYPGRPDDLVQDNVRMNIALTASRS